jgi:hypothetical protein
MNVLSIFITRHDRNTLPELSRGDEGSRVTIDCGRLENGDWAGYNDIHDRNQFVWVTSMDERFFQDFTEQ